MTLCFNCFHQHDPESGVCPHCGFDLEQQCKDYPIALSAGTMLNNRYYVGRVLGQGGFGITYVALDTNLNAKVAIKEFMPSELATRLDGKTVSVYAGDKSQEFDYGEERFLEEARTLAQFIGNPNIAGVSNYFTENETSYFVMDYIEGISFKAYIAQQGGTVPLQDALNVMIPVLTALGAVHKAGFIHRDVTPDNIFITKDGGVKLLDFGSARYSVGDRSKSLDVILKVGYAPKEQYIRRGRQGPFTDVYSCAACLYACLTSYLPPESLERMEDDTLAPVSQVLPEIPEYINNAILKGLAVNAEDRFQSAQEFLEAIETQTVVQVPTKEAPVPPKKKSPAVLIAAIAAVAVIACVGIFALGGNKSSDTSDISDINGVNDISVSDDSDSSSDFASLDSNDSSKTFTITIGDDQVEVENGYLEYDGYVGDAEFAEICQHTDITRINLYNALTYDLSDISPVANLTELTYLFIDITYNGYNCIQSYAPLQNLTKLEVCRLGITEATDVEYLSGLSALTELEIYQCDTTDLSWMANMTNLESFDVMNAPALETLSGLEGKASLTELYLRGLLVLTDISALETSAQSLENLMFSRVNTPDMIEEPERPEFDYSVLAGATNLKSFFDYYSCHSDLSVFENWPKLQETQLDILTETLDLEPLRNLTELTTFSVSNYGTVTSLTDLEPLSGLTKLEFLWIDKHVKDLSPLKNLTNLTQLGLSNGGYYLNMDGDLTGLSNLTNLTTLYLSSQNITSLEALSTLENLNTLHVTNCNVTDVSPIAELPKLQYVFISTANTSIENKDLLSHVSDLTIYDQS